MGRAPLIVWQPPLLLLVRGYARPAVSSLDQIEPVSKADAETPSSCCLSWGEPGMFPTDRLNFTTVCCKAQYRAFGSLVCQCLFGESFENHVWHYAHESSDKSGSTAPRGEQHTSHCASASVRPGWLQTHQIPPLTSTMGHKEHVIGQHTAAVQLAAEQPGVQITERLRRGKSYPWKQVC